MLQQELLHAVDEPRVVLARCLKGLIGEMGGTFFFRQWQVFRLFGIPLTRAAAAVVELE